MAGKKTTFNVKWSDSSSWSTWLESSDPISSLCISLLWLLLLLLLLLLCLLCRNNNKAVVHCKLHPGSAGRHPLREGLVWLSTGI